jgi:DNA-binding NarL/FixJ family response regulator
MAFGYRFTPTLSGQYRAATRGARNSRFVAGDMSAVPSDSLAAAKEPIRVLMLEDSEADAELIRHELRRSGVPALFERVDTEDAFSSAIREFAPDVVLSDHSLAQFDAQAAMAVLRKLRPLTPLILVTGSVQSERTVACLRAGAEDLIIKGNLSRLAAAITGAVRMRRPLEKLTPRQIEVLRLVVDGYRTREIATRLELSVKTVESHRGEIMKRLRIHDVVSLVRYAISVGLVAAGE